MNGLASARRRPFLLDGSQGPLFAVYFPPRPGVEPRGDVLVVPPFAEEMNRCRAMVTMQALAWAETGVGTLVVDLRGTGDSSGEYVDADWNVWRDDLRRGIEWLSQHGQGCAALLGIRLGAILAAEIAGEDEAIGRLLFWQPVLNGKTFYTQFLRIRIAAEIDLADGIRATDELRRLSAGGTPVEVSGYAVSPALATALDTVAMPGSDRLRGKVIDWFEVIARVEAAVPRASTKAIEEFQAAGLAVTLQAVVGPPFWQVHEREIAPDLVTATTGALSNLSGRGSAAPGIAKPWLDAVDTHERPLVFPCGGDELVGIVHAPAPGSTRRERGVVVVVAGGPQYRAGAHRQFVSLARKLALDGYPVLRFDLRGMGDSGGSHVGYQQSEPDIRAAVDALLAEQSQLREVVLLGECESASGILFFAWRDPRIAGAVLVNPWVRTEEGQAQVIIKHYYLDRLRSPELWQKIRAGKFSVTEAASSLFDVLRAYWRGRRMRSQVMAVQDDLSGLPLPQKTAAGLQRFGGHVLLLMSGNDYIAREFDEVTASSAAWRGLLSSPRVARRDLAGADHTFSRAEWKSTASDWVVEWLRSW